MQHYTNRQDGFKEIKKQIHTRMIIFMLFVMAFSLTILITNSKDKTQLIYVLPVMIPLFVIVAGSGFYLGLKRQKKLFESYRLTLTNNLITREQLDMPVISIYFNEIKAIIKNKNGSFTIKGKNAVDLIAVPAQIENHTELEKMLNQIMPVQVKINASFMEKYISLFVLLIMVLMICLFTVTNKIIVFISGTILLSVLSWSLYEIRRSKNIDIKTKRGMWTALIVMAVIIAVMIIKLAGIPKV